MNRDINNTLFDETCSTKEDSLLVLLPIPWEVTTSYGGGASMGPEAIKLASHQLDFYNTEWSHGKGIGIDKYLLQGLYWENTNNLSLFANQKQWCLKAKNYLNFPQDHDLASVEKGLTAINTACEQVSDWVYKESKALLSEKKLIGVIGGDHSCPQGAVRAISEFYDGELGILHIDAHADLRKAYQGFTYSHASIMYNIMNLNQPPKKLVQVALRDVSIEEVQFQQAAKNISCFYNTEIQKNIFSGGNWDQMCQKIINLLPENVYISFDIDGLSPNYCPGTGTPVPGGITYDQAIYLIQQLVKSNRKIVGFDLCEVAPSEDSDWDGNVGARVLYNLCGYSYLSNGLIV